MDSRPLPWSTRVVRSTSLALVLSLAAGCAPSLDWREVRVAEGTVIGWFPCKPVVQSRTMGRGEAQRSGVLLACDAAGLSFSWLTIEPAPDAPTGSPEDGAILVAALESAGQRWGTSIGASAPIGVQLPASIPAPQWRSFRAEPSGQRPATQIQALFWSSAGRVHQVVVSGPELPSSMLDAFFGQLRTH